MLRLVGPLNADFDSAWDFKKQVRGGRRPARKGKDIEVVDTFTTDDDLNGEFATTESLFSAADDLWGIVGWAFTCSVSHPKRWKWWKLVLELLLDALEMDWFDRAATNAKTGNKNVLEKSLISKYLPDTRGSAGYKRVIRAILANDNGKNFNEWKEVWKDELSTKRPKKVRMGSQDNTYMGDDTDDEGETVENTATKVEAEEDVEMGDADDAEDDAEDDAVPSVVEEWGGMDAVILRQRFLCLVSNQALITVPVEVLIDGWLSSRLSPSVAALSLSRSYTMNSRSRLSASPSLPSCFLPPRFWIRLAPTDPPLIN